MRTWTPSPRRGAGPDGHGAVRLAPSPLQEGFHGLPEAEGSVEPREVAGARLNGRFGPGEQPCDGGRDRRQRSAVPLAREHQDPGVPRGEGVAGCPGAEGAGGGMDVRGPEVDLLDVGRGVCPGCGVPTALEEGGDGVPVVVGGRHGAFLMTLRQTRQAVCEGPSAVPVRRGREPAPRRTRAWPMAQAASVWSTRRVTRPARASGMTEQRTPASSAVHQSTAGPRAV